MFRLYYKRTLRDDHEGIACCFADTDEIFGIVNLNNIVRGSLMSASLGYFVSERFAQRGFMTQALQLVLSFAFHNLGLHRVEANIQPGNEPSRRLVQRCGFELEGISRAFLFIDGNWRDHERWVKLHERDTLTPTVTIRK